MAFPKKRKPEFQFMSRYFHFLASMGFIAIMGKMFPGWKLTGSLNEPDRGR